MKVISAVVGGLLVAIVAQIVVGLAVSGFVDTTTDAGRSTLTSWQAFGFVATWIIFGAIAWRARTTRKAWGRSFLWLAIMVLAAPVATAVLSVGYTSRQASGAAGVGAGIGGGIATVGIGIVSFFLAAIFLILAVVLLRGGAPRPTEATKKCPACAETILAAANVCRFCGHRFEAAAPATTAN